MLLSVRTRSPHRPTTRRHSQKSIRRRSRSASYARDLSATDRGSQGTDCGLSAPDRGSQATGRGSWARNFHVFKTTAIDVWTGVRSHHPTRLLQRQYSTRNSCRCGDRSLRVGRSVAPGSARPLDARCERSLPTAFERRRPFKAARGRRRGGAGLASGSSSRRGHGRRRLGRRLAVLVSAPAGGAAPFDAACPVRQDAARQAPSVGRADERVGTVGVGRGGAAINACRVVSHGLVRPAARTLATAMNRKQVYAAHERLAIGRRPSAPVCASIVEAPRPSERAGSDLRLPT
jgi:hypothetical protein